MSENQKRILEMLAQGKISVDEAQRLLALVGSEKEARNESGGPATAAKNKPRYLHVTVEPKPGSQHHDHHGKVNVRVPFGLIRAGMKLASLIPQDAADKVDSAFKEKGIPFDFRKMKDEDIEELITALHDSEVNVEAEDETVRVYAE